MNPSADDLRTRLATDLADLYEHGIPKDIKPGRDPALAELALALTDKPKEPLWESLVNALVLAADGARDDRQLSAGGILALYGIPVVDPYENPPKVNLNGRRDDAARLLRQRGGTRPYASGDSLRYAKFDIQPPPEDGKPPLLIDVARERLADALLDLATEKQFSYSGKFERPERRWRTAQSEPAVADIGQPLADEMVAEPTTGEAQGQEQAGGEDDEPARAEPPLIPVANADEVGPEPSTAGGAQEAASDDASPAAPRRWSRYAIGLGVVAAIAAVALAVILSGGGSDKHGRDVATAVGATRISSTTAAAEEHGFTSDTARLQLVAQVKLRGETEWSKEIEVQTGADIQWRLATKNVSNVPLMSVVVRDVMPPHLRLVPGSVRLIDAQNDRPMKNDPLFAGGFDIGNYERAGTQYIIFDTVTRDDFDGCDVRIRNIAHARSDQTAAEAGDWADAVIRKPGCDV
ncbi:hypothetical protein [Conexibacter sp. CPCC 206217]|uniref:hypothetical protein n=1 Tax=Conexibacter sp. CPCC 206217 TaxID=3064574 RepID=UPI0027219B08|nr:hypothetical protein [Conexibacter sp. CPCC 206217]MDO8213471.1 hypothetical protein [Conexibacter sp. CPCC 206217]